MASLFETIREAVADERFIISAHGAERLDERNMTDWQVAVGLDDGVVLQELPEAEPLPKVKIRQMLPDGTEYSAIWSYDAEERIAVLVTVHYFDRS